MTLPHRLKKARTALGLTQKAIAEQSGVSMRGYQGYEDGRSVPGGDAITRLVELGINANWLLTGKGEMFTNQCHEKQYEQEEHAPYVSGEPPASYGSERSGYVALPLYNEVYAAAGHGGLAVSEEASDLLMFKEDWIRYALGAKPADLTLIRVSGNSMEPTLRAGDVILIDRRAQHPNREGIYVLRIGDGLLVKNVQLLPGGMAHVTSDNPSYRPFELRLENTEDVAILGRVVWAGRQF